jgi:hypothetical protein
MTRHPDQIWWAPKELAQAGLPDVPGTKQGVNALADRANWRGDKARARRRAGRGGGWEYHWTLLPLAAQKRLLAEALPAQGDAPVKVREDVWAWFDAQPQKVKDTAKVRLDAIQSVEALERAGNTRFLAVSEIARDIGKSDRTIWNWFGMIEGVATEDRLAYLAPRHRAAQRSSAPADCDEGFWDVIKADYLRPEAPSFSSVYRRAIRIAGEKGWAVLSERTMQRRMDVDVSKPMQLLARKGMDALKRLYPAQTRDKSDMHALEYVNADYHKFDVFVKWPRADGNGVEIIRPQMCAFQDIYSGRILCWRLDRNPNKSSVALTLGELVEQWGIPQHVVLDNGREFANKYLTGQTPHRHRFKVKEDDIPGLLTVLGCEIHWAKPYSGQSKPIERAFRDMCDDIAKDPRLAGAYTGNTPLAHPENYGSRAVDYEVFLDVVADGIAEHNARRGRRAENCHGRSFIETFDASYANAPIRKATAAQRRLWLMGAEGIKAAPNGEIRFEGNRYWDHWMVALAGKKVVVRFDPADLHAGLHVYELSGEYLGYAQCLEKTGFGDVEGARSHERERRRFMKLEKERLNAIQNMNVVELAKHLDEVSGDAPVKPEATVVRPVFEKTRLIQTNSSPQLEEDHKALIASFEERKARKAPKADQAEKEETEKDRYIRAINIEQRLEAGKTVGRDEQRWLSGYQTSPEYRAQRNLHADFGDAYLGA